jgi:hypothetical protein
VLALLVERPQLVGGLDGPVDAEATEPAAHRLLHHSPVLALAVVDEAREQEKARAGRQADQSIDDLLGGQALDGAPAAWQRCWPMRA